MNNVLSILLYQNCFCMNTKKIVKIYQKRVQLGNFKFPIFLLNSLKDRNKVHNDNFSMSLFFDV